MKRIICFLLVLVMLPSIVCFAYNGDVIVYVTNTGEKYHNSGCGYLRSRNAMTLEEAVESGYTPCSRCDPPLPDFTNTTTTSTPTSTREPVRVVLPGSGNSNSQTGNTTILESESNLAKQNNESDSSGTVKKVFSWIGLTVMFLLVVIFEVRPWVSYLLDSIKDHARRRKNK